MHFPLLSVLIWLPILSAVVLLFFGDHKHAQLARFIALTVAAISLIVAGVLWCYFMRNSAAFQFNENISWLPMYGINYSLGIDGISLPLVILTTITTLIVVLASWRSIQQNVARYLATFLLLQGMMVGVFCALDSILFYVFWEATLIPIYLNLGIWGDKNRGYASVKFFIYTFAASALMLLAILYLRVQANSFMISDFYHVTMSHTVQDMIFIAFLLAFAVKIPIWPVHTWLPDVHSESPAGGSVVVALLMLKLGVYGFLRFNLPITPNIDLMLTWLMIILSLVAIVYVGLIALVQTDMKRLIAYSSIAHMGFAVLGAYMIYIIVAHTGNMSAAYLSLEGAMMQMIAHAFSTGGLFIGVSILYDRLESRSITDYSGLAHKLPLFAALMMLFALANVGLPGTAGFVGEFMVILSSFKANFWVAFLAATTLVIGAAYTLWLYKRVFFGKVLNQKVANIQPLYRSELLALLILAALVILIGVYPMPVLNVFHASVDQLLQQSLVLKLPI